MPRRRMHIGAGVLVLVLLGAACGGDDSSSVSTGGTSTTTPSNNGGSDGGDGNDVLELQRELLALGCDPGPLDGTLGPDTKAAIRSFQSVADLVPDGIVGPDTRAVLATANQTEAPKCPATPPPPPSTSPTTGGGGTPTTGGGGNAPQCTEAAIRPVVAAGLNAGEQLFKLNQFNCASTWAVTTPTVGSTPQNAVEITMLLRWNGSAWQVVDRGVYCDNGDVPQTIYQESCESN